MVSCFASNAGSGAIIFHQCCRGTRAEIRFHHRNPCPTAGEGKMACRTDSGLLSSPITTASRHPTMEHFSNWHGVDAWGMLSLGLGVSLVFLCTRLLLEALGVKLRHPAHSLCAFWVVACAVVTASVQIAGKTGCLSAPGIAGIQLTLLVLLAVALHRRLPPSLWLALIQDDGRRLHRLARRFLRPRGRGRSATATHVLAFSWRSPWSCWVGSLWPHP